MFISLLQVKDSSLPPTRVLLYLWLAQFWRFLVVYVAGFACLIAAIFMTMLFYKLFTGNPPSRGVGKAAFYSMIPVGIWAWIRAFCGTLNRNYGGYRIVIERVEEDNKSVL
jgi:hypothetical protein